MADLSIKTTTGEIFTEEDSRALATLIYRRFGRDATSATLAWNRLLQDNCTPNQYMGLFASNPAPQSRVPANTIELLAGCAKAFRQSMQECAEFESEAQASLGKVRKVYAALDFMNFMVGGVLAAEKKANANAVSPPNVNVDARSANGSADVPKDDGQYLT